jgi:hypothetical protein
MLVASTSDSARPVSVSLAAGIRVGPSALPELDPAGAAVDELRQVSLEAHRRLGA